MNHELARIRTQTPRSSMVELAAHNGLVAGSSPVGATNPLLAAAPALLAAARLALDYLETMPYEPSIHPSTKAQDALHDAIVAAQGLPPL